MQRNFRHYLLNIELYKTRYIFFITLAAFLIYLILVMIASKGPQLYDSHFITKQGGETYCNDKLDVAKPGEIINWANPQSYYQCLSCYELSHPQSQKISFTASKSFSTTPSTTQMTLTELTSPFLFSTIYTCKDLMRFTNQRDFPLIQIENHQQLREVIKKEGWSIVENNQQVELKWKCKKNSENQTNFMDCATNQFINQRVKNQKIFAYFTKFSMNYSISDDNNNLPIHFQVQEENPSYFSYTFYFKVFFLSISIYMLIYLTKKLKPIKFIYWLAMHKWLYILLTVLILFNDPFGILNILLPNIFFDIVSDLSEVLFNIILLYFWLVLFETAIKQSGNNRCIFNNFKAILIIFAFIAVYLKIYALVYRPQHQLIKEFEPSGTLAILKATLIIFSLIYLIYLFTLSIIFYQLTSFKQSKSQIQDKIAVYNYACVLSNLIAVVIILQWINNFKKPDYASVQSFVIPYSIINIYLFLLAILYSPAEGQNLTEVKQSENYDIIKNIYGDAIQLHESEHHNSDDKIEGSDQKVYIKN